MLSKNKKEENAESRELDLNIENDRRIVREFEKELEPYEARSLTVMRGTPYARELRGLELYLHENGIFRYSEAYPLGAVANIKEMQIATQKNTTLCKLRDRREWASKQVPSV